MENNNEAHKAFFAARAPAFEIGTPEICFECGGTNIVQDLVDGNASCRGCGLVLSERTFDTSSEWRSFEDDSAPDRSRVGLANDLMIGSSSATSIAATTPGVKDGGIARIARRSRHATATSKERLMEKAVVAIDEMASRMNVIPTAKSRAKQIFECYFDARTAMANGRRTTTFSGKNLTVIFGACLFIARRETGSSRSFEETGRTIGVNYHRLGSTVKNIGSCVSSMKVTTQPRGFDKDAVMRMSARAGFDRGFCHSAADLAASLSETILMQKMPKTIAGIAIYINALLHGKDKESTATAIVDIAGIAKTTLLSATNEVYKARPELFPKINGGKDANTSTLKH